MGKGSAHSKHKNKQAKAAQFEPQPLSKTRWGSWGNLALGAAAATSPAFYVWRKMRTDQIDPAGESSEASAGMSKQGTEAPQSMTNHLSGGWNKAEQSSEAPAQGAGRDIPVH